MCPGISLDLPVVSLVPLSSLILFHPSTALHRPRASALPGPIVCEHPTRSGESTPSLSRSRSPGGKRARAYMDFLPSLRGVSTEYLSSPSALISERDQSHHGRWMFRRIYIYVLYTICSTRLSFPNLAVVATIFETPRARLFDYEIKPISLLIN